MSFFSKKTGVRFSLFVSKFERPKSKLIQKHVPDFRLPQVFPDGCCCQRWSPAPGHERVDTHRVCDASFREIRGNEFARDWRFRLYVVRQRTHTYKTGAEHPVLLLTPLGDPGIATPTMVGNLRDANHSRAAAWAPGSRAVGVGSCRLRPCRTTPSGVTVNRTPFVICIIPQSRSGCCFHRHFWSSISPACEIPRGLTLIVDSDRTPCPFRPVRTRTRPGLLPRHATLRGQVLVRHLLHLLLDQTHVADPCGMHVTLSVLPSGCGDKPLNFEHFVPPPKNKKTGV